MKRKLLKLLAYPTVFYRYNLNYHYRKARLSIIEYKNQKLTNYLNKSK